MKIKFTILVRMVFFSNAIFCQEKTVLSLTDYIVAVRSYHPAIVQAGLNVEISNNELLTAKGGFDPILTYQNNQKTLDNKKYFQYQNIDVYVPIGLGIELYGGLENNTGDRINTELTKSNSSYAGLSIPLARDIIIDQRRAVLRQSKKMVNLSIEEKRFNVLQTLQEAQILYYEWTSSYIQQILVDNIIKLNNDRLEAIRVSIYAGERASIDSIEMLSQLNSFRQIQAATNQEFKNLTLELSTYLWDDASNPIMLRETTIPDTNVFKEAEANLTSSNVDVASLVRNHPKVLMSNFKIDILHIEQKLKQQNLLPKADLKYNFIKTGLSLPFSEATSLFNNNYKFGIDFSIPIPNRKAVGEVRAQKAKVNWANLDLNLLKVELTAKVKSSIINIEGLKSQISMIQEVVNYNEKLIEAELIKLSQGESSIFLVNARQNKVLESNQKLIQLQSKLLQEQTKLSALSGDLLR